MKHQAGVLMNDEGKTKKQLISELTEYRKQVAEIKERTREHCPEIQVINQRLEFERIVATVSSRFVGVGDLDKTIMDSLEDIGNLSSADRAYLFLYDNENETMSNTHEWCAEGIQPERPNLQNIPVELFPWWQEKMENGEIIHIPDLESLPDGASVEKEILSQQNIKSLVALPVSTKDTLIGFIGFDDVVNTGEWNKTDLVILNTVSEIIGNAFQRKIADETIMMERERAEKYFDMAPAFMITLSKEGRIENINQRGCRILQVEKSAVIGRNWFDEYLPDYGMPKMREAFGKLLSGELESIDHMESPIMTTNGEERVMAWNSSLLRSESGEVLGILSSGEDVTERRLTEEQMKRKLLKYKLMDGRMYLIKESSPKVSIQALNDLLKLNYGGIVISRLPEKDLACAIHGDYTYYWLAEMENGNFLTPDERAIEKIFEDQKGKIVALIDRIDYLISKIGFKKTLECIQRLREMAYIKGFVIIISIDPTTLKKEELRRVEKEGLEVEAYAECKLPESLTDVLNLVHSQNSIGLKPSYSLIGDELGVSKPTMRKRITSLIESGYLQEETIGRMKILELGEKGVQLFRK